MLFDGCWMLIIVHTANGSNNDTIIRPSISTMATQTFTRMAAAFSTAAERNTPPFQTYPSFEACWFELMVDLRFKNHQDLPGSRLVQLTATRLSSKLPADSWLIITGSPQLPFTHLPSSSTLPTDEQKVAKIPRVVQKPIASARNNQVAQVVWSWHRVVVINFVDYSPA